MVPDQDLEYAAGDLKLLFVGLECLPELLGCPLVQRPHGLNADTRLAGLLECEDGEGVRSWPASRIRELSGISKEVTRIEQRSLSELRQVMK